MLIVKRICLQLVYDKTYANVSKAGNMYNYYVI
jgi:hypothetical protein